MLHAVSYDRPVPCTSTVMASLWSVNDHIIDFFFQQRKTFFFNDANHFFFNKAKKYFVSNIAKLFFFLTTPNNFFSNAKYFLLTGPNKLPYSSDIRVICPGQELIHTNVFFVSCDSLSRHPKRNPSFFYLCVYVVSNYKSYQQGQLEDSILLHWSINFHAIFSLLFVYFTYVTCIRVSIAMLCGLWK